MTLLGLVATNRVVKTTGTQENQKTQAAYTIMVLDTTIRCLDDSSRETQYSVT